jgi:hypothetical protein
MPSPCSGAAISKWCASSAASASGQRRPHNLTVDNLFVAEAAGPSLKHPVSGEMVDAGFRAQKFVFVGTQ